MALITITYSLMRVGAKQGITFFGANYIYIYLYLHHIIILCFSMSIYWQRQSIYVKTLFYTIYK